MVARISLKCDDCKNKFNLTYFFIKPDQVKCPACGSIRVREEAGDKNSCGCGSQDKPFRFT